MIAVLCNNRMALPAIRQLLLSRALCGIAIPAPNTELADECRHMLAGSGMGLTLMAQDLLEEQLSQWMDTLKPAAVFMMTFPWRIPAALLDRYPGKLFNFHYGLLPDIRGADPVFESIRQQQAATGITVHLVTPGLDKGPILLRQELPLSPDCTHGSLCAQLGQLGAQLSQSLALAFSRGAELQCQPQPGGGRYYPRPTLKDVSFHWEQMDSTALHALARACNPWNKGAYTSFRNHIIRVTSFSFAGAAPAGATPGSIVQADATGIFAACRDGQLLRVAAFYTDEGFFEGTRLSSLGLKAGDRLVTLG